MKTRNYAESHLWCVAQVILQFEAEFVQKGCFRKLAFPVAMQVTVFPGSDLVSIDFENCLGGVTRI